MLKTKSALFISLLFATQLAAAGGVVLEKQPTPPFDQSPNSAVTLEQEADNVSIKLDRGIIVQKQLAGGLIIDKAPDLNPQGGMVLERGGIKLLSGVMVPEAKLAGVMIPERTLAGGLLIERHLAGGLIVDRYGRNV